MPLQDGRRYRRVEGPVIVEYHLLDGSGVTGCSPAANISEGGVQFPVDRVLPAQTPIQLRLHVGRLGASPAVVQGNVVWVRPAPDGAGEKPYDVGVSFDAPSTQFMRRLLQRIYAYWAQVNRPEPET